MIPGANIMLHRTVEWDADFDFLETAAGDGTIAGLSFGVVHHTRRLFVAYGWRGVATSGQSLSSLTLGGNALTVHIQSVNRNTLTNSTVGVAIASGLITTGTSGSLLATPSVGNINSSRCAIYRGINLLDNVPYHTGKDNANETTEPATFNLDLPFNGFAIAMATISNSSENIVMGTLANTRYDATGFEIQDEIGTSIETQAMSAGWGTGDYGLSFAGMSWRI